MATSNNSNKGWGGPFDFNGDGKTTWEEEAFGLALMEQCRKNNESSSNTSSYKSREGTTLPTIKPVPEVVDEKNYSSLLADYRSECICAIIAMVLFLAPAVLILWAVYSTYDPDNSASGFLTILFTVAGLFYGGVVLSTTGKSISASLENIDLVKKRYSGPAIQKATPKKKKWWLCLFIPVIIASIFIASSKESTEDADTDKGYAPSYYSYTPSSNASYNSSQRTTKQINTTPAMTKEEAERLRGTGYHGTRPNSTAESIELKAAQVKCETCGMHSDNGVNSQCDACAYNQKHGLN